MPIAIKPFALALLSASVCLAAVPARADTEADATAIRATLEQWRQDFNARRSERICDLFAPELRADFQGLPEQDHTQICTRLRKTLADPDARLTLGLRIQEVIVSGSTAVVRLTWTNTVPGADGKPRSEDERGLDVFARQPDGRWKIVRYMAYPVLRE